MEFKDYYETLGVKSDATDAEIKSAYRRLARKYHPDVSKEADAEDKFKAVNEAYEALRDPSRRKAYDQLRAGGYRGGDPFRGPPPNWQRETDFGGGGDGNFDQESFSDFFESLFGGRGGAGRAGPRSGRDLHAQIAVDLGTAYHGGRERITLRDGGGERTLEVKIPAGIAPGQQIRLAGQGYPGMHGGKAGDLILEVGLRSDPRFQLDGRDVLVDLPIAPWEAALGATVTVPTLAGNVELRVPAGSDGGRKMRLRGRGWPGKTPGDQIVTLRVRAPKAETAEQRELYESLAKAYFEYDPRA
ncbi:DnaJ C-terminal domain-containing protein [Dokdonella sp.]|uniref:DnaJ C-terminal domain-containing protein n=1 Tax=Dokdonella sp. TaxID=2291710 RepID=UPI001B20F604|nr:DnaJ C-terminal domain-containing protein [Dokdonella sp.]MBO9662421.1 DnaJ domain-containing protein [Dokdonella sp.]